MTAKLDVDKSWVPESEHRPSRDFKNLQIDIVRSRVFAKNGEVMVVEIWRTIWGAFVFYTWKVWEKRSVIIAQLSRWTSGHRGGRHAR